jgi:hypothetical protein
MDFSELVGKMICIINEWTGGNYPARIKALEDVRNPLLVSVSQLQERVGGTESAILVRPIPTPPQVHTATVSIGINPIVEVTFPNYIEILQVFPLNYTNAAETDPNDYNQAFLVSYWTYVDGVNMVVKFQILGEITDGAFTVKFTYKNSVP